MTRSALGKTALAALKALNDYGPLPVTHGYRYASCGRSGVYFMSSTNHMLRVRGMITWAGNEQADEAARPG